MHTLEIFTYSFSTGEFSYLKYRVFMKVHFRYMSSEWPYHSKKQNTIWYVVILRYWLKNMRKNNRRALAVTARMRFRKFKIATSMFLPSQKTLHINKPYNFIETETVAIKMSTKANAMVTIWYYTCSTRNKMVTPSSTGISLWPWLTWHNLMGISQPPKETVSIVFL